MENVINNIYSRHINTSLYSEMVDVPLLKFFRAPAHLIHPLPSVVPSPMVKFWAFPTAAVDGTKTLGALGILGTESGN